MSKTREGVNSPYFYTYNLLNTLFCLIYVSLTEFLKYIPQIFTPKVRKNISGQIALITGGGNGLGRKISIELAKKGCNIAIADIDDVNGNATVKELIKAYNIKAKFYKVDVSNFEEIQNLKTSIENDLGPVDILVNNAGILQTKSTLEATTSEFESKIMNINYLSQIWTLKTFLHGMLERKRGHVISICSMAGLSSFPVALTYVASKAAVKSLMQGLKIELILNGGYEFVKTTTVYPYFMGSNKEFFNFVTKNKVLKHWPALRSSDVARETVDAMLLNKHHLTLPGWWDYAAILLNSLPNSVLKRIGNHFYDTSNI